MKCNTGAIIKKNNNIISRDKMMIIKTHDIRKYRTTHKMMINSVCYSTIIYRVGYRLIVPLITNWLI